VFPKGTELYDAQIINPTPPGLALTQIHDVIKDYDNFLRSLPPPPRPRKRVRKSAVRIPLLLKQNRAGETQT